MFSKHKGLATISLLVVGAMLLSGCSIFHRGPNKVSADEVSFLLMLWAPSGALAPGGAKSQEFQLTLQGPALTATFFSDRPKRLTAQVPLPQLVTTWAKMGLADKPPFVAVIANQGKLDEKSMTGELLDPKWNANKSELSFTLRPANRAQATPTAFASPAGENLLPPSFGQVTVMIDPSGYQGVEYIVTADGVVALRESYSKKGPHPIDVLPPVTYIGPDYFGAQRDAALASAK